MAQKLTIVGGGLGGLTAAIAAREAGFAVTLHEATSRFGGRGRSSPEPYVANWGPHVIYSDGEMYRWLRGHGALPRVAKAPLTKGPRIRVDGRPLRVPPARLVAGLMRLRRAVAPVDPPFGPWAADVVGPQVSRWLSSLIGVATFHHDPGSLSAAFVHERLVRVTGLPPAVRYPVGGWGPMLDRLAGQARESGVELVASSRVDSLPEAPVIVALPLPRAAVLLGDPSLRWTGARTALWDVALSARRGDPFLVGDADESGWVETFSYPDPSLCPAGAHLVQAQMPLRPGEELASGLGRLESLVGSGYRGWGERVLWQRRARVADETGAVDPPGVTWRDRPPVDRGDGVMLVGDMVAAPGLLGEVSHASALQAVARLAAQ